MECLGAPTTRKLYLIMRKSFRLTEKPPAPDQTNLLSKVTLDSSHGLQVLERVLGRPMTDKTPKAPKVTQADGSKGVQDDTHDEVFETFVTYEDLSRQILLDNVQAKSTAKKEVTSRPICCVSSFLNRIMSESHHFFWNRIIFFLNRIIFFGIGSFFFLNRINFDSHHIVLNRISFFFESVHF
jgi:hypothetical protein